MLFRSDLLAAQNAVTAATINGTTTYLPTPGYQYSNSPLNFKLGSTFSTSTSNLGLQNVTLDITNTTGNGTGLTSGNIIHLNGNNTFLNNTSGNYFSNFSSNIVHTAGTFTLTGNTLANGTGGYSHNAGNLLLANNTLDV